MRSKVEKYTIRDVKIEIVIKKDPELFEKTETRTAILELHKENDFCLKFDNLKYIFYSDAKGKNTQSTGAWIDTDEVNAGSNNIYIGNNQDLLFTPIKNIKGGLLHELVHIWYFRTHKAARQVVSAAEDMEFNSRLVLAPQKEGLYKMRSLFLTNFSVLLLMEGIADYVSNLSYDDAGLDQFTFARLYNNSLKRVDELMDKISAFIEGEKEQKSPLRRFLEIFKRPETSKT